MEEVFSKLVWSFNAMWLGIHPLLNEFGLPNNDAKAGTPLAGGYFACVWALPGDLDFWRGCYGQPNSKCATPCPLCPCNNTTMPWFHFSTHAAHLANIHDETAWRARNLGLCGIFCIVGVNNYSLHPDWMHAKHLGTDKVLCGSVLFCLINFVIMDGTPDEKLARVWERILFHYARLQTSCKYGQLKMTMFTARTGPKLKGKAAEVKGLIPVLHKVWLEFYTNTVLVHRHVELVLRTSVAMDAMIDAHQDLFSLPAPAARDLVNTCFAHLYAFWELRQHWAGEQYPLFQLTQKGHYLMHSCLLAHELNPRLSWCYTGEDFMGKMRDVCGACSKGCSCWAVSNKTMDRWSLAMHLTLTNPAKWFRNRL